MMSRTLWWVASVPQLIGVVALAARLLDPMICFGVMLTGSAVAILAAKREGNSALVLLNSGYTITNIVGLIRWHYA